jgi:hypothetical protein
MWYHKAGHRAKTGQMQVVVINRSVLPTEMFLRILLACLVLVSSKSSTILQYLCNPESC